MSGTVKESPGVVNRPIHCGGVYVKPGDVIVGDDDGVVVVPKEMTEEILKKAQAREERERKILEGIQQGVITDFMHIYGQKYKALIEDGKLREIRNVLER